MCQKKQMDKSDWAFVDFQGFKSNSNRFIVKEFAMKTKNIKFHDIVKSPKANVTAILDEDHQRQAKWLTENYHGLDWNSGFINLNELRSIIKPILMKKIIYIKGEEKVKWLKDILNDHKINNCDIIINLETIGCTINLNKKYCTNNQQSKEFRICNKHLSMKNKKNPICHCSRVNISILSDWYFQREYQE